MNAQIRPHQLQDPDDPEPATLDDIRSVSDSHIGPLQEAQFEADLLELVPFLRSFARSLSRNTETAEDLTQDALLNAWRGRGSYKPGTNLKAWLCTILRNNFCSQGRRAWRQMPWDQQSAERISIYNPEQVGVVDLADTLRALEHMSAPQREALTLIGAGGLSYREAAAIFNCDPATLKSRVARGRRALESLLEDKRAFAKAPRSARREGANEIMAEVARLASGVRKMELGAASKSQFEAA